MKGRVAMIMTTMAKAAAASNTISSSTAGYGTGAVSGATANSVAYTLSADGSTIIAATVVFAGDLTGKAVSAGFNASNLSSCTLGAFTSGTTTATCSGLTQPTATATQLAVAVR